MKLYKTIGSQLGSPEASVLADRLTAWHDAMVAHERRLQVDDGATGCQEDCAHDEARELWSEAVSTFAERASDLSFLRSRGTDSSKR